MSAIRYDLTKIRRIGPTCTGRCYAAGITTVAVSGGKAIVVPACIGNWLDGEPWIHDDGWGRLIDRQ